MTNVRNILHISHIGNYKYDTWYFIKNYGVYFKFDKQLMATIINKKDKSVTVTQWYAHNIDRLDRIVVEEIVDQNTFQVLFGK